MANKPGRPTKGEEKERQERYLATEEIWKTAREQPNAEIMRLKQEIATKTKQHEAAGALKKIRCDRKYNDLFEAIILYRVHESRLYKEGGYTWETFCNEIVGIPWRTADDIIQKLRPIYDELSANFADFSGVTLSEIKYLGRAVSANIAGVKGNIIEYKGQQITVRSDEWKPVLEDMKDELKKLKEEHDLDRRTYDRRIAEDRKHREKLEHTISKLEKEAERKGMSLEDDAFLKQMEIRRKGFDGYMLSVDPSNFVDAKEKGELSPRMVAAYLSTLDYMRKQILAAYDTAIQIYGNPVIAPEKAWRPGVRLS